MPNSSDVQAALKKLEIINKEDLVFVQMVVDLQATTMEVLFPGFQNQPTNPVGIIHHAAQAIPLLPAKKQSAISQAERGSRWKKEGTNQLDKGRDQFVA